MVDAADLWEVCSVMYTLHWTTLLISLPPQKREEEKN